MTRVLNARNARPSELQGQQPINRWPARLDLIQSASGLILVLFMWMHMFLVSSILLGKDAMYYVARFFEGEFFLGRPYPILVSLIALFIGCLIALHALLALRKFPQDYRAYHTLHNHLHRLQHSDTTLWYVQVITGFALFFLISIHLYQLFTHPADIGPYASSDRVWSGRMWPLYLVLLFMVEIHGSIGLYRLVVKWCGFPGEKASSTRRRLQLAKWGITIFFLVLGLATLAAYMEIGIEHSTQVGERFYPVGHRLYSP